MQLEGWGLVSALRWQLWAIGIELLFLWHSLSCPASFIVVTGSRLWPEKKINKQTKKHQGQKHRVEHPDTLGTGHCGQPSHVLDVAHAQGELQQSD